MLSVIAFVVLGAGALFLWRYFSSYESTDDAQVDAHLYPVSARVPGHVIRVNVGDNEWVHKGAVLVEIDPKDYQVAVAVVAAEKQLAAAQEQLEQAQANDVKAQHDLARYKMLVDEDEVSRQVYDTALAAARAGTATVAAEKPNQAATPGS